METVVIDVREKDEFAAEHIENSISLPLSNFAQSAPSVLGHLNHKPIMLMCRSGKRAGLAFQQIKTLGIPLDNFSVYTGGITGWKNEGKAVVTLKRQSLPIMRQVQLVAGSLVFLGSALAFFVHPSFLIIPAFVGAGLVFAGASGFCGMATLLSKMPWNR